LSNKLLDKFPISQKGISHHANEKHSSKSWQRPVETQTAGQQIVADPSGANEAENLLAFISDECAVIISIEGQGVNHRPPVDAILP
jgi:hypothetical protein